MRGTCSSRLAGSIPLGVLGARQLRPHHAHPGSVGVRRAVLGRRRRSGQPGRGLHRPEHHRRFLAQLAELGQGPGPSVEALPGPQRPDPEGAQLRPHRRHHGGVDDLAAGNNRRARNWDYRFTWIRDSAFMLRSLYRLGFDWEAIEYWGFPASTRSAAVTSTATGEAADHVRHRRGTRPDRTDAGPPVRVARSAPSPGQQRGLEPAAARRVGDDRRRPGRPVQPRRRHHHGTGVGRGRRVRGRRPGALA